MSASEKRLVYLFALLTACVHFLLSGRAGYFSDETYFIDCSKHLAFGYFDLGPLIPLLIRFSRWLFGPSLFGLRFFPALGHAGTVFLGGLIARELGGKIFAQLLACLCILIAPGFLMLGSLFLSPSLEPFFWTLTSYIVLLILTRKRVELWPLAGAVVGIGYMNKPVILLLGLALTAGIALSQARPVLANKWFALGLLTAFLIMLPNLLWQTQHDWNTLRFLSSVPSSPSARIGWAAFLVAPVLALNPVLSLFWIGGFAYLAAGKSTRPLRVFAWVFPTLLAALLLIGGKAYYISGIYPFLFAAGAVLAERRISARTPLVLITAIAGVLPVPAGLPILSAGETDRYLDALRLGPVSEALQLHGVRLDMEGQARERFLKDLSHVYSRLDPPERESLTILTAHYFQASWINVLGAEYGLPRAVSGNNAYYQWGPGSSSGETTLGVGFTEEQLRRYFASVERVPEDPGILVCRHPHRPLSDIWTELRSFPF